MRLLYSITETTLSTYYKDGGWRKISRHQLFGEEL